jgi:hypothetical protein
MTISMARIGTTRAGSAALAAVSALFAVLLMSPALGQLMGNFGLSYQDALLVVGLVSAGSIVLFWLFPYLIPFLGTLRLLLIYFGAGAVIGW